MENTTKLIHATTIYLDGYGVMISGPSGIGKSSLALDLLNDAHGFEYILLNSGNNKLVADDQTLIAKVETDGGAQLQANCPQNIEGKFEVRGLGIINLPYKSPAPINLYVEIVDNLPERMPAKKNQTRKLLGVSISFIQIYKNDRFAKARVRAALYAHMRDKLISS
ncbi:MAG: hypothetical protein HRU28_06730 [Rhizobiales bacterium]|nr:hypothetical protein [Hyphomicrobiales bacterium]